MNSVFHGEAVTKFFVQKVSVLLVGLMAACSPQPDVVFLASDAHFLIGGHHLVVPVVAIGGASHTFHLGEDVKRETKAAFAERTSHFAAPAIVEQLQVTLQHYGSYGEQLASRSICPLLQRRWAHAVCVGHYGGMLQRLPGASGWNGYRFMTPFILLDPAKTVSITTTMHDALRSFMQNTDRKNGMTQSYCDDSETVCTAVIEVLPGLIAMWLGGPNRTSGQSAREIAKLQGEAVVQFVQNSIGPIENTTLSIAD